MTKYIMLRGRTTWKTRSALIRLTVMPLQIKITSNVTFTESIRCSNIILSLLCLTELKNKTKFRQAVYISYVHYILLHTYLSPLQLYHSGVKRTSSLSVGHCSNGYVSNNNFNSITSHRNSQYPMKRGRRTILGTSL